MTAQGSKDLVPERRERIKDLVRRNGAVRVDELTVAIGASSATVRRDLEALETAGALRRVHGGAVSSEKRLDEPLFDDKASWATEEKERIASVASGMIESGDTIYLDGGSTVLGIARRLHDRTDITVVTNSLRSAVELSGKGPKLILVGGELRRRSQSMVGVLTRGMLEHLHVDKAFMGTIGLSLREGVTTTEPQEAFTKQLVMRHSERVVLLADSSKVGKVSFAQAGAVNDIHVLITDPGADSGFVRQVQQANIEVIQA